MTDYTVVLFLHIVGVLMLFTGIALETALLLGMRASRTVEQVLTWGRIEPVIAKLFPYSAVVLLLTGIYLWHSQFNAISEWAIVALVGLIVLSGMGSSVNTPRARVILQAAESTGRGEISRDLRTAIFDPVLWISVLGMSGATVGIVFLMTTKPGWLGSIAAVLIGTVIGAAIGQALIRREAQAPVREIAG